MQTHKERNCIVDKSLKIIKLVINAVRLILYNFRIIGFLVFGRIPVDSSHFFLNFDSIWSPKYFILKVKFKGAVLLSENAEIVLLTNRSKLLNYSN
jgi:hypothetical protein